MDLLTEKALKELTKHRQAPAVSIYMPTHPAAAETAQDAIRFKNLMKEAARRIERIEFGAENFRDGQRVLGPARALAEDALFWRRQNRGLALFASPDFYRFYRLPTAFDERVQVTDRFYLRPLLPLFESISRYYVLALSRKQVRLLHCTRHWHRHVSLHDVPESLADALRYDDIEKQLQFHTGTPGGRARRAGVFHGHGVGRDDTDRQVEGYVRQVARGVEKELGEQKIPLVLAVDDPLFAVYTEVNRYPGLLQAGVRGNPEEMSGGELRDTAWPMVASYLRKIREGFIRRYREFADRTRTTGDVCEAVKAAFHGRVDLLFVTTGEDRWGRFDTKKDDCEVHPAQGDGDEDLLDLAAFYTMANGGRVYPLAPENMPESGPVAALLRY